jgi:arabinogalactan oligomer/maltooligosaccharide transport system permease protein
MRRLTKLVNTISRSWRVTLSYFALIAFTLFSLYPISQIITIALRPSDQLLSTSLALIPKGATLDNFRILVTQTPFCDGCSIPR